MSVFFISDLHFNHGNIIKYCNRPFVNADQMNRELVRRWNSAVSKDDTIFHLGDFCKRGNPYEFINKLNGHIIFIEGNHDEELVKHNVRPRCKHMVYRKNAEDFMLIHTNEWLPHPWDNGWIICGHHHNNNVRAHPLIHNKNKLINVSAELLDYTPIEASELLSRRRA